MLDSLGTEISFDKTKSSLDIIGFTFQLYRPAGIRWRGGVRELHTAGVLVAVGVPCLVLHTDCQDRLMGDLGGKYCCTPPDWPRCTYPPGELSHCKQCNGTL